MADEIEAGGDAVEAAEIVARDLDSGELAGGPAASFVRRLATELDDCRKGRPIRRNFPGLTWPDAGARRVFCSVGCRSAFVMTPGRRPHHDTVMYEPDEIGADARCCTCGRRLHDGPGVTIGPGLAPRIATLDGVREMIRYVETLMQYLRFRRMQLEAGEAADQEIMPDARARRRESASLYLRAAEAAYRTLPDDMRWIPE